MSQILTKCQFLNIFKKSLELPKIFKKGYFPGYGFLTTAKKA